MERKTKEWEVVLGEVREKEEGLSLSEIREKITPLTEIRVSLEESHKKIQKEIESLIKRKWALEEREILEEKERERKEGKKKKEKEKKFSLEELNKLTLTPEEFLFLRSLEK